MIYIKKLKYLNKSIENLAIKAGINLLKGKNGSGKTMFFDELAGLTNSREREIEGNKDLVYLNQHFYFHNRLKTRDFIKFIYQLNGINKGLEHLSVVLNNTRFLHFKNFFDEVMDKELGSLSGGERRIVYDIGILTLDKEWYLLDEPFNEIDRDNKEAIVRIIQSMVNEGKSFIISDHQDTEFGPANEILI